VTDPTSINFSTSASQPAELYLGDGSWGRLRAPKKGEDRPYIATVSEAYHMTVHRLEGQQRFHVALEESGKIADVCMTANKRPARRS
jgi:hypothetical protein